MRMYFITSNSGKFDEVRELLATVSELELEPLELTYPEIQADTLKEVTEFALKWLKGNIDDEILAHYIMIEDSGLFVDRLNGFPGVYSAYAHRSIGGYRSILTLMDGEWDRRARFETCIGLITTSSKFEYFRGECQGKLSEDARGTGGFGYDPIFIPDEDERTFAEMSTTEKNQYSHRFRAVSQLKAYFEQLKE